MTRSKKLLILLISLVAVIAVFFIVSSLSSSYTASLTDETTELFSMGSTDDATAVSWDYEGNEISFSKNEGTWEYSEDPGFPVDEDAMENLLYNFTSVTSSKTINDPDDISQYGLDDPKITIDIEAGDNSMTFEFGNATNITGEYYCSIGDGNVYLVSSAIADDFSIDALSLVDKEDVPDMSSVNSLTVTNADKTYNFEHIENSGISYSDEYEWFYNDNGEYTTLDNELFDTYLNSAASVSFISCVTYNATEEELAEYGLDEPAVSLNVNYTRTEETETDKKDDSGNIIYETKEYIEDFDLDIGNYDGDYCYARIPGSSMVYLINASVEDTYLYTSIDALVPDDVINMDWSELTGFDVTIDGNTYNIECETTQTEDENGISADTTIYKYNGDEITEVELNEITQDVGSELESLSSATTSGKADVSPDGKEEVISFVFYRDNENYPKVTLEFYRYDSSSYITVLNGETTVLADSSTIDSISESFLALLGVEEAAE
jgi:hypothetical protein